MANVNLSWASIRAWLIHHPPSGWLQRLRGTRRRLLASAQDATQQAVWVRGRYAWPVNPPGTVGSSPVPWGVCLSEDMLLRKPLRMPANLTPAAQNDFLALQAQLHSPFADADTVVLFDAPPGPSGAPAPALGDLVIASRPHIMAQAAQSECWVKSRHAPGWWQIQGIGPVRRQRAEALSLGLGVCLGLGLLAGLAAWGLTPSAQLYQQVLQSRVVLQNLQAASADPAEIRQAMLLTHARVQGVGVQLQQHSDVAAIWQTLSAHLPLDAHLHNLTISNNRVTLSGEARNSSDMMLQLGQVPGIQAVSATTPAVRRQGAATESYTVEFTFARPAGQPTTPAANPP